jgi:hypothetical protein
MRTHKGIVALAAVLALGLIAAGCGGGDDTSTVTIAPGSSTTSTSGSSTTSTSTSTTSGATPQDVYDSCIDVIKGTPAEATGQTACQQAKDAFEQCAQQAQSLSGSAQDTAIQACQSAANQTVDALKAAGG